MDESSSSPLNLLPTFPNVYFPLFPLLLSLSIARASSARRVRPTGCPAAAGGHPADRPVPTTRPSTGTVQPCLQHAPACPFARPPVRPFARSATRPSCGSLADLFGRSLVRRPASRPIRLFARLLTRSLACFSAY